MCEASLFFAVRLKYVQRIILRYSGEEYKPHSLSRTHLSTLVNVREYNFFPNVILVQKVIPRRGSARVIDNLVRFATHFPIRFSKLNFRVPRVLRLEVFFSSLDYHALLDSAFTTLGNIFLVSAVRTTFRKIRSMRRDRAHHAHLTFHGRRVYRVWPFDEEQLSPPIHPRESTSR